MYLDVEVVHHAGRVSAAPLHQSRPWAERVKNQLDLLNTQLYWASHESCHGGRTGG